MAMGARSVASRLIRGDLAVLAGGPAEPGAEDRPAPAAVVAQLQALAQLYSAGCRRIVVAETDEIPADRAAWRADVLGFFAEILVPRGFEPVKIRRVGADARPARLLAGHAAETARVWSRRGLVGATALDAEDHPDALTDLQRFHAQAPQVRFAAVPRIDPRRCTGCDACLNVCPHEVLTQINDKNGKPHYATEAANCDACGLCVGVCASSAIDLDCMTFEPSKIPLRHWTCRACGVSVHAPERNEGEDDGYCEICRGNGHHKKLFQVLP